MSNTSPEVENHEKQGSCEILLWPCSKSGSDTRRLRAGRHSIHYVWDQLHPNAECDYNRHLGDYFNRAVLLRLDQEVSRIGPDGIFLANHQ